MRAIVSSVLALLLAVTPLKQVLGQAHQQAAITPELSVVVSPLTPDSLVGLEPVSVVWLVPRVESIRWTPPSPTTGSLHLGAVQDATGFRLTTAATVIIAVVAAVVFVAFLYAVECGEGPFGRCFGPGNSADGRPAPGLSVRF